MRKRPHGFKKVIVPIEDISCAVCARKIETSVSKMGGVDSVTVFLPTKTAVIKYDEDAVTSDRIISKIKELGYTPCGLMENHINASYISDVYAKSETRKYFLKFIVSAFISAILFLDFDFSQLTFFVFTGFSWLYCGWHFHKGFYHSLKNKSADMNTLVSLSSSVMFAYISFFVFFPNLLHFGHHFFHWHEVPMLLAFINFGKFLEEKSRSNVSKAINQIENLFPKFASKLENGKIEEVRANEIKVGDTIIIKPGQQVPVDGEVISGNSYFDLRFITGENAPVLRKKGDFLYAGSINSSGSVKVKALKVGEDMMLSKLASAIKEAQNIKINIQKNVDKISAYFVPIVIFIAFFSGFFWLKEGMDFAINTFASVLVIACPCAMGLSVPLAVMLGYTKSIQLGFVINNPIVFENFSKIDVVLLDKTGVLTDGKMSVSFVKSVKISQDEFLRLLLTAQSSSENIFSTAVKNYCLSKAIEPQDFISFQSFPGYGVKVEVEKGSILAGNMDFLRSNSVSFNIHEKEISESDSPSILLSFNGEYLGYVSLEDPVRENAKSLVESFIKAKIKPIIVSGDKKNSVKKVADFLGIDEYYYEVKPDEKHSAVLKYKALGHKVLMIGDGINDSAALNEADIGVAMKNSAELTSSLSDIVLLSDDISKILNVINISENIRNIIRQNLFWAFVYNIILIPIAAGALYPISGFIMKPYMSALAMGLSSVSVVLNSLRLLKMKV